MKTKRKTIEIALLFGLIAAILLSFARFDCECENLRRNVLRLHIIANSDSAADQTVKLKIRDEILRRSEDLFQNDGDLAEAEETAERNLAYFTDIANEVLKENGFEYRANVTLERTYFNTRKYEDFTLPAGYYQALNIRLGKAAGKNWWCVVFPSVCLSAAGKHSLKESADAHSASVAEQPKKYTVRFKSVEIFQKIYRFFKK